MLIIHILALFLFIAGLALFYKKDRFILTSPILCFGCGIILFNYLAAIKASILSPYYPVSDEILSKAAIYSNLCNFTFIFSIILHKIYFTEFTNRALYFLQDKRTNNYGLLLAFIAIFLFTLYGLSPEKILLLFTVPFILLICEYRWLSKKKFLNFILLLLLFPFMVICIFNFSRFHYLPIFLTFLFVGLKAHGRVNFFHLFFLALFLLILGSITKTIGLSGKPPTEPEFWIAFAIRLMKVDFLDSYDNYLNIIAYFPDKIPYISGDTILASIFTFVPRDIWPSKSISMGRLIADAWEPYHTDLSLAPLLHGELHANFGILGSMIAFYFIGLLLTLLDTHLKNAYLSLQYSISVVIFVFPRGDFLLIDAFYYFILPYVLLLKLLPLRKKLRYKD